MKLREFIVSDAIVPKLSATDRDAVMRELVTSLASAGAIPADGVDEVVAALIKREQNGSTGFGKGVAVPHVKHPKVKKMAGTIGRSARGSISPPWIISRSTASCCCSVPRTSRSSTCRR